MSFLEARWGRVSLLSGFLLGALVFVAGCGSSGPESPALRLVEEFGDAAVSGTPTSVPKVLAPRWGGGDSNEEIGDWKAGIGFVSFELKEGHLVGKTKTKVPLIYVAKPESMNQDDSIHALEIRMRVSAGSKVEADFTSQEEIDFEEWAEDAADSDANPSDMSTNLIPGDDFQTYLLTQRPAPAGSTARIQNVVVRPTDEEGADVEIESIRVIFRKEHLLSTPTGVSWQGLSNVYRESLVSRTPERIVFSLDLPSRPWLDLSLGTVEGGPVTFRVAVEEGDSREVLLQKTVTTPHHWVPVPIELEDFSGKNVDLSLELEGPEGVSLGIWGAPVIRNRGQAPVQSAAAESSSGGSPRGVILIVGDTLRRDHLNLYGYERETAPTLAKLAHDGVLFTDNQSQGAWTKVSVPSILTSLYPTTHGIVNIQDRISATAVTAAEAFQKAGYATWASSSVPFSGQLTNLHQGVEVLYERPSVEEPGAKTARPFIDYLLPWLETHKDTPFFIFLHVFDPHSPFEPRPPYNRIWLDGERRTEYLEWVEKAKEGIESDHMKGDGLPSSDELQKAGIEQEPFVRAQHDLYDGSIKGMDDEIARVLEALEQFGIRNDTMIAFLSDHGEEFLEHGYPFHGLTIYGDMTNVPMLINFPGRISAGTVVEETVQSIDLLPTLLELSGLEIPEIFQGKSLIPLMQPGSNPEREEELRGRPVFSERRAPAFSDHEHEKRDAFAVVQDGWKLVYNTFTNNKIPEYELFDHQNDPINLTNVADQNPEIVERMAKLIDQYLEESSAVKLAPEAATEGLSEE
ncbi:MAG: sulfatase [Acidobacteriota bacterium]|nr:MAG: sulfatase [Acidobacteriota bacterium]